MIISRNKCNIFHSSSFRLDNVEIDVVSKAKNLGVIFNSNLTWSDHLSHKISVVYSRLRNLWQTQNCSPFRIRMLLSKTFLFPALLYASEVFAGLTSEQKQKLKKLCNNVARYIFKKNKFDHISKYTNLIFGMTIDNLLNFRALLLLHKIIQTRKPIYLYKRLTFSKSIRNNNIMQLKHKHKVSDHQFFIHAIRLWNDLPNHLKFIINSNQFRNQLYSYFCNL